MMKKILKSILIVTASVSSVVAATAGVACSCSGSQVSYNDDPVAVTNLESIVNDFAASTINNPIPVLQNTDKSFIELYIVQQINKAISADANSYFNADTTVENYDSSFQNTIIGDNFTSTPGTVVIVSTKKGDKTKVNLPQVNYSVQYGVYPKVQEALTKVFKLINAPSPQYPSTGLGVLNFSQNQSRQDIENNLSVKINQLVLADPEISEWISNPKVEIPENVKIDTSKVSGSTQYTVRAINVNFNYKGDWYISPDHAPAVVEFKIPYNVLSDDQDKYEQAVQNLIYALPKMTYSFTQLDTNYNDYLDIVNTFIDSAIDNIPIVKDLISSAHIEINSGSSPFDVSRVTTDDLTSGNIQLVAVPKSNKATQTPQDFTIKYKVIDQGKKEQAIHDNEAKTLEFYLKYFQDEQKPFEINQGETRFNIMRIAIEQMIQGLFGRGQGKYFPHLFRAELVTNLDNNIFLSDSQFQLSTLTSGDIVCSIGSAYREVIPMNITFNIQYVVKSPNPVDNYEQALLMVMNAFNAQDINPIYFQTNTAATSDDIKSQIQLSVANYINSSRFLRDNLLYKSKDDIVVQLASRKTDIDVSAPISDITMSRHQYTLTIKPNGAGIPLAEPKAFTFNYLVVGQDQTDTTQYMYDTIKTDLHNKYYENPFQISAGSLTPQAQKNEIIVELKNYISNIISTTSTDPNSYDFQMAQLYKTSLGINSAYELSRGVLNFTSMDVSVIFQEGSISVATINGLSFDKLDGNGPKVFVDSLLCLIKVTL